MTLFKTSENIHNLFNMIAAKYDFMNNLISLGLHKYVKRESISNLDIVPHSRILDACTGTGDLVYLMKQKEPLACITGIDFSENMLNIARTRMPKTDFRQMDAVNIEYPDNTFDFVTMGFGLRNIINPEKALSEIYRVIKPGGEFLHLDFGRKNIFNKLFNVIVPIAARIFYGNSNPYKYLIKSKKEFPEPEELIKDFEKCGFTFSRRKDYIFGALSIQIMKK